MRWLATLAVAAAIGCGKDPPAPPPAGAPKTAGFGEPKAIGGREEEARDLFVKWFKAHGHSEVVTDADGVGVRGNATRLRASLYGSNPNRDGFVVELEFTVRLPSGRTVTDFVAGMGETESAAVDGAFANFTLTTFHVLYKGFINPADSHLAERKVAIGGAERTLLMGDILLLGKTGADANLNAMRTEIAGTLAKLELSPEPHWFKIVYSQNGGKAGTVSATMDNEEHPRLTEDVKSLGWPRSDGFYLAKQFIVVK